LFYCTIEPEAATGQVPVVNRQPHIGGDFVAKLPMQDGDALLHPVSFQRDQLEIVSVAPVKQVAGFWFVLHCVALVVSCECVFYQIRRSVSSVPSWVDVVRPSLVFGNPLVNLSEPRGVFGVFICEGDTGLAVVHLLTAEALVASHESLTGHRATGTVDRLGVVVVRHCVFPCLVLYAPHYSILSAKVKPNRQHISQD